MRRFQLIRHEDVSGVSGTGVVAEGVEFTDKRVTIRWFGDRPSTVNWDSLEDAMAIHGHNGSTTARWLDGEGPTVTREQVEINPAPFLYRHPLSEHIAEVDRQRHPEDYTSEALQREWS